MDSEYKQQKTNLYCIRVKESEFIAESRNRKWIYNEFAETKGNSYEIREKGSEFPNTVNSEYIREKESEFIVISESIHSDFAKKIMNLWYIREKNGESQLILEKDSQFIVIWRIR